MNIEAFKSALSEHHIELTTHQLQQFDTYFHL